MHAWRFIFVSTLYRISRALLVIFHGRQWRFATQIIEVFFLFAQWWTAIHNPRLLKIHTRCSEIFNDGTCTGGWFWIHSRNFSLMTTVNHFVNDCPNLNFDNFHTWDCSREYSPGCTRTFECGGCPSVQQSGFSPPFVFLCAFFMTSFHSFSTVASASGINIAWNERSFAYTSRFPEACVSERQISRVFWTIRNSRFPKFAEQNNTRSSYFFLPRFSWEYLVPPGLLRLLEEFCLTDTLCRETRQHVLAFTFREN